MISYPRGRIELPILDTEHDPGRQRDQATLMATYGHNQDEVEAQLEEVELLGQKVLFSSSNGAADALHSVSLDIDKIVQQDEEVHSYLLSWDARRNPDYCDLGTFYWRKIKGTDRLSAHSFGIAIDLYSRTEEDNMYWLWQIAKEQQALPENSTKSYQDVLDSLRETDTQNFRPQNVAKVPWPLITAFEEQNFIWGGKWYHYDTIHFEYRPEL